MLSLSEKYLNDIAPVNIIENIKRSKLTMNEHLNIYLMALSAIPQLRAEIDIKTAQLNVIEKDDSSADTYAQLHGFKLVAESADNRRNLIKQFTADIEKLNKQIDGMYKIMDNYYDVVSL